MADWSTSNRACTTLWSSLYNMNILSTNFQDSGVIKMSDLTIFNALASEEVRRKQAEIIADQLDNIFRIGRGAKYENGVTRSTALTSLVTVLTNPDKTVSDLAAAADECYAFWGETKN